MRESVVSTKGSNGSFKMEFFAGPDSQAVTLVLSFLTTQELLRVRCCCKGVQARTRDQTLWREACQRDFGVDVPVSSGTPVAAAAASVSSSGSITFSPPASPAETTWTSLMAEYGRYFAGYARVEKFVARCEAWASSHFPELLPTMVRVRCCVEVTPLLKVLAAFAAAWSVRPHVRRTGSERWPLVRAALSLVSCHCFDTREWLSIG
jgi:hypothetical protein